MFLNRIKSLRFIDCLLNHARRLSSEPLLPLYVPYRVYETMDSPPYVESFKRVV